MRSRYPRRNSFRSRLNKCITASLAVIAVTLWILANSSTNAAVEQDPSSDVFYADLTIASDVVQSLR